METKQLTKHDTVVRQVALDDLDETGAVIELAYDARMLDAGMVNGEPVIWVQEGAGGGVGTKRKINVVVNGVPFDGRGKVYLGTLVARGQHETQFDVDPDTGKVTSRLAIDTDDAVLHLFEDEAGARVGQTEGSVTFEVRTGKNLKKVLGSYRKADGYDGTGKVEVQPLGRPAVAMPVALKEDGVAPTLVIVSHERKDFWRTVLGFHS